MGKQGNSNNANQDNVAGIRLHSGVSFLIFKAVNESRA
jgi:hypothetical protein